MPPSDNDPDRLLADLSALEQTALADFLRVSSDGANGNSALSEEKLMTSLALAFHRLHPTQ